MRCGAKVASGECCFTLLPEEKTRAAQRERCWSHSRLRSPEAGFSKKESRRLPPSFSTPFWHRMKPWRRRASIWIKRTLLVLRACSDLVLAAWKFSSVNPSCCTKGAKRVSPLFIPTMISNMAAGNLAIRYGLKGDCLNIVTACSTGTHCVGEAYRLIRFGLADADCRWY